MINVLESLNQLFLSDPETNLGRQLVMINSKKIRMDENRCKINTQYLETFKNELIKELKEADPIFKELYSSFYHCGSYYLGLRIAEASEFDLNIVLNFPCKKFHNFLEVQTSHNVVRPSFARCKLIKPVTELMTMYPQKSELILKVCNKWFDDNNFLKVTAINTWMQSIVDKVLHKIRIPGVSLKRRISGPAVTIKLEYHDTNGYNVIDIDLVPVFKFSKADKWPKTIKDISSRCPRTIPEVKKYFFIVPKSVSSVQQNSSDRGTQWRLDFPDMEKALIHSFGCSKLLIKLLKLLRDCRDWKGLASYHLKTLVMWQILKNPDPRQWSESNLGCLFKNALQDLALMLSEAKIPFLFDPEANLLEGRVSEITCSNIRGNIQTILKDIKNDPSKLDKHFMM